MGGLFHFVLDKCSGFLYTGFVMTFEMQFVEKPTVPPVTLEGKFAKQFFAEVMIEGILIGFFMHGQQIFGEGIGHAGKI